jgi:hypothetical protein
VVSSTEKIEELSKKKTYDVLVKSPVSLTRVGKGKQANCGKHELIDRKTRVRWLEEHPEYKPWNRKFVDLGVFIEVNKELWELYFNFGKRLEEMSCLARHTFYVLGVLDLLEITFLIV